jgi:hypothetical protein
MSRELLEVALSGDLDPVVRKRLVEVVQLVQSYWDRLVSGLSLLCQGGAAHGKLGMAGAR